MNDCLPNPDTYKSEYLQQLRQGHDINKNISDNVPCRDEPRQIPQKSATNQTSTRALTLTEDPVTSSTSLTQKNEAKRCLFGKNVNKRKFRSTKPTQNSYLFGKNVNKRNCRFIKPTEFTMQRQQRRKGNNKEERKPNTISAHRYDPFKTNGNHSIGEWSADTLRFLIHNCTGSYNVCSLLWFVKKGGSIIDYYNSKVCKDVFGEVSLSFLQEVYHHRVPIMSYYRRLGCYPNVGVAMLKTCIACDEVGKNCQCPALGTSFNLFCRQPCSTTEFDCKCKNWSTSAHMCFDSFSCAICDEYYKSTSQTSRPSYAV